MSTDLGMMEPSPFDDDAEPSAPRGKPWEPARPMSQRDLDIWLAMPLETRVYDAYRCMFNLMAEDGIGLGSGTWMQCKVRIADPTRSRYCMEHAAELKVEFYSPAEFSELTAAEVSGNLTRLVPKAVRTLERVMDDDDAPPGIRAKAADSILDRTGYAKGVDVRVDAQVAVVDITSVIRERLDALRDAKLTEAGLPAPAPTPTPTPTPTPEVVSGTVLPEADPPPRPPFGHPPNPPAPTPRGPAPAAPAAPPTPAPVSTDPASPVAETRPDSITLAPDDDGTGGPPPR